LLLFLGCLLLLLICSSLPCFADNESLWLPDFETDGVKSVAFENLNNLHRWGFIDKSGKFVIAPKYDRVKRFKDGRTIVGEGERYFEIDKSGKAMGPPKTRIQVINESNQKRWAKEAEEAKAVERAKYRGDVWDVAGKQRIGSAEECKVGVFSEGLATCTVPQELCKKLHVDLSNCMGYINSSGRFVIPPQFARAEDFKDGLAKVELSGIVPHDFRSAFIDKTGKIIGNHYYVWAWDFENGFAIVGKEGKTDEGLQCGFIDRFGKEIMGQWTRVAEFSSTIAAVRNKEGLWGFIDRQGQSVLPPLFTDVDYDFSEGLTAVQRAGRYGYLDTSGKYAIPPQFADCGKFSDGLAAAAVNLTDAERIALLAKVQPFRCGFIDKSGKEIIKSEYFAARHFSEGLAAVQDGMNWGFVNEQGSSVIPAQYEAAHSFSEGLAAVLQNDKWGFIDKTGKIVIEPKFAAYDWQKDKTPPMDFSDSLAAVAFEDYCCRYVTRDGAVAFTLPVQIRSCPHPDTKEFVQGLAPILDSETFTWGYINRSGKYQMQPTLESASTFSEGLAAVKLYPEHKHIGNISEYRRPAYDKNRFPEKVGFINAAGDVVIQPIFDKAESFRNGLAPVALETQEEGQSQREGLPMAGTVSQEPPGPRQLVKWGFVDKSGKLVVKTSFDEVKHFSEDCAAVMIGTKWGYIDGAGKTLIEPRFDDAAPFSDGLAAVKLNGRYGYIDKTGKFIVEPKFLLAGTFADGRALIVSSQTSDTTVSTGKTFFWSPLNTQDDVLNFLIQAVSPPDEHSWEGQKR